MKTKLTFLAGAGVGYLLGARAGRARYEQIKRSAAKSWQSPPVQDAKEQAANLAKEQLPKVQDAAKHAATAATEAVQSKLRSDESERTAASASAPAAAPPVS